MNQELKEALLREGGRFPLNNVAIDTGESILLGVGTLYVEKSHFRLDIALDDSSPHPPAMKEGIVTRSQFWRMKAVLDHDMDIEISACSPQVSEKTRNFRSRIISCRADAIGFPVSGFDKLTYPQVMSVLHQQNPDDHDILTSSEVASGGERTFFAIVKDYNLKFKNGGTTTTDENQFLGKCEGSKLDTLSGFIPGWEFGLIQRGEDLHIHLKSAKDSHESSRDADLEAFRAFLDSVAFMHGQHAWYSMLEHRRNLQLVIDRVRKIGPQHPSFYCPFDERIAYAGQLKNINWDAAPTLSTIFQFFSKDDVLVKQVRNLLFLFRSIQPGLPRRMTALVYCSLFESLITATCQSKLPSFPEKMRDRYFKILELLSLPRDKWDPIFDTWRDMRNPLSHHIVGRQESESGTIEETQAEAIVACAINMIILKLAGYSGYCVGTMFPAKHWQI